MPTNGLLGRAIADVPVAVLDFETTGIFAPYDRVVEVSVVRIEPGSEPKLVLDTLINPERRVDATFIHGIADHHVADAPRFADVADRVLQSISGCVLAAYNVAFDLRFLESELNLAGVRHEFPNLCLMYLRPMLGLGRQCQLREACRSHGIALSAAHAAAHDALASANLWNVYARELGERNIRTFAEMAAIRHYSFVESFDREPYCGALDGEIRDTAPLKSRYSNSTTPPKRSQRMARTRNFG